MQTYFSIVRSHACRSFCLTLSAQYALAKCSLCALHVTLPGGHELWGPRFPSEGLPEARDGGCQAQHCLSAHTKPNTALSGGLGREATTTASQLGITLLAGWDTATPPRSLAQPRTVQPQSPAGPQPFSPPPWREGSPRVGRSGRGGFQKLNQDFSSCERPNTQHTSLEGGGLEAFLN